MYLKTLPKVIKGMNPELLRSSSSQSFATFCLFSWVKNDLQDSRIDWSDSEVVWTLETVRTIGWFWVGTEIVAIFIVR